MSTLQLTIYRLVSYALFARARLALYLVQGTQFVIIVDTKILVVNNMRIWDVPVKDLCRVHLLGEHRELHALWTILTTDKKGYRHHPETKRWVGKLAALYVRHQEEVVEMRNRGYTHSSPLDKKLAHGKSVQDELVSAIGEQKEILLGKKCKCSI